MRGRMLAGLPSSDGLRMEEVEVPVPGPGQVLVRVAAAGLNRADLGAARAQGKGPARPIGMEWAGEIVALGDGVQGFAEGQTVMCSGAGGYAQYAVADASRCIALDGDALDVTEAVTLPLALMTAHDALITNGRFSAGDSVLERGASSAVGLMVMRVASARGARAVVGLARDKERRDRLSEFGATHVFDPQEPELESRVDEASGGKGIDVIVDMVSGEGVVQAMRMAAVRARIVNVGRLGGASAPFDFELHALKRIDYVGVTFRTRSKEEIAEIVRRMKDDLWKDVLDGGLRLPLDRTFALAEAPAAHEHMRANAHFGKIALTM